jgi:hypothetical protein
MSDLQSWFKLFEKRTGFDFGLEPSTLAKKLFGKSFAEVEEFALSVYRQYVLQLPGKNAKAITQNQLSLFAAHANAKQSEEVVG